MNVTFGEFAVAVILAVVTAAGIIAVLYAVQRLLRQHELRQRGFEVKPTTGPAPVLREKADDHG